MKTARKTAEPDVFISDEGTLFLFRLLTRNAEVWVEENVESGYQTLCGAIVVEHRYAMEIANGMMNDGLRLRTR